MTTKRFSRHWLLWGVGAVVLGFYVVSLTQDGQATTKKTDAKKEKGKDKDAPKKEGKVEPPPAKFPARIDVVDGAGAAEVAFIDEQITKNWKANNSYPSDRCTDFEFIRRVSLDIVGRIPTVEEIDRYMKQPEYRRRSWLVNAMLDGKEYGEGREYAQNFANIWTVNLMTRTGSGKHYQQQMNDWLYNQFKNGDDTPVPSAKGGLDKPEQPKSAKKADTAPDWSKTAYQLIAAQGETNRNAAVNYLLHNLGEQIKQDPGKTGKWDMVPATSRTTRLFLGIRTQCVQCHDHPFNGEWRQEHFWGINAFFRQVDTNGRPTMMAKKKKGVVGTQEYEVKDNKGFNSEGIVPYERRNAVLLFVDPTFLSGEKIPANKSDKLTRREHLAKFVTASPWFAKAFVNRTWGHFFGISFTRGPVDDFHAENLPSHPELLEKLATDWAKRYNHNPKVLIRWICNSQAYGLSSRANKWNDKTEDESLFARMLLKPMTPEQMFTSVLVATHPRWQTMSEEKKQKKLEVGEKEWYPKLVANFGNDEGEEGSYSGTVIQALLLMNGKDINAMITDKEGTVDHVISKRGASYRSLPFAIQDLYKHVLNRPPTQKEVNDMMRPEVFNFRPNSKTQPTTPEFWRNYYQDVIWALLNSNEFILNH